MGHRSGRAWALVLTITALGVGPGPDRAHAYGALLPAVDADGETEGVEAVTTQVLFEGNGDVTTVHVLVRFEGRPSEVAWLLPVPAPPTVAASEPLLFPLLDRATQPAVTVQHESLCPEPQYVCQHHPDPICSCDDLDLSDGSVDASDAHSSDVPPGVDVLRREVVAAHDILVFASEDASEALEWLAAEGFVGDATLAPFMEPYVDAGMSFVAARISPDAATDGVHPVRISYPSSVRMVPLVLTAISAAPEMALTVYLYGDGPYAAPNHGAATIAATDISSDARGRVSHPMVLSRTVDEAGGNAFVTEYGGPPPNGTFMDEAGCCALDDPCGIAGDGLCQCPALDLDAADCDDDPALVDAARMLDELAASHSALTRLTTRVSPHEVASDAIFEPVAEWSHEGRVELTGSRYDLAACAEDVFSPGDVQLVTTSMACTAMYCGAGKCVFTEDGTGACECEPGHVARRVTDLDDQGSVVCVLSTPVADLAADHGVSFDACAGVDCGMGACVDVGGFPACRCDAGAGAVVAEQHAPRCVPVVERSGSPGAENFSARLRDVRVCDPAPASTCGPYGWLAPNADREIAGESCASSGVTDPELLEVPPEPRCPKGCTLAGVPGGPATTGPSGVWLLLLLALLVLRKLGAGHTSVKHGRTVVEPPSTP
jgi:hypothetical protein